MLLGIDTQEATESEPLRAQRPTALVLGVIALAEILLLTRTHWTTGAKSVAGARGSDPDVETLARSLFTRYVLGFEITSLLLVIAIVGAVVLARRPDRTLGAEDAEDEETDQVSAR